MKKILLLFILILNPILNYSQCGGSPSFPGVSSYNPIEVGYLNINTPFTDIKNNSPENCFGNTNQGQPSDDIWYKFSLSAPGTVYLSHCGSPIDTFMVLYNANVTMQAYNDNNESFCGGTAATTAGIKINLAAGTYFLVSEGKGSASGNIFTTISLTPIAYQEPNGDVSNGDIPYIAKNYITTYTPRENYSRTEQLNLRTPSQVMKNVQYFDGLGRVMQTVQVKASPGFRDIVQPIVYDSYGREAVKYFPYVATVSQSNGEYKATPIADVKSFYSNPANPGWNAPGIVSTNVPFSQSDYESSPLQRLLAQGATGEDWQIGSGHEVRMAYGINLAQQVIKFSLDANGLLTNPVYWDKAALHLNSNTSEDNLKTNTFTDKQFKDRIYIKRLENKNVMDVGAQSSSYWMDTYYVYNQRGELAYVLPPELIKQYVGYNGENYLPLPTVPLSSNLLDKFAYQYKYDSKGRLIGKHLPGKEWELIVYSQNDLPILTQDGNLRNSNEWLFTKYDIYARNIASGITTISLSGSSIWEKRELLQQQVNTSNSVSPAYETSSSIFTSTLPGYTNLAYPYENLTTLTLAYYDDYKFLALENITLPTWSSLSGNISQTARGMETGSRTRVLGTNYWILDIKGYDSKGQLIWNKKTNPYLTSSDLIENNYNFTGDVIETVVLHSKLNNADIETLDRFTYDHTGKMIKHTQCINGNCGSRQPKIELIAANQYNEIGQLIVKKVGNTITKPLQSINYNYNVRGWLNSINNPENLGNNLFAMKLGYNTLVNNSVSANPNFNGNISSILWSSARDNIQRMYGFKYDGVNRLKKAAYSDNDISTNQNYDEGISSFIPNGIDYDYNGNILKLTRNGLIGNNIFGLMDRLTYSYEGNQLLKVEDPITLANTINDQEFKNGNNLGDDYIYDVNGNMTRDLNKQIITSSGAAGITYNHLNLPKDITFNNGNKIEYIYTATGEKLQKKVIIGANTDITHYDSGFIYTKKNAGDLNFEFFSTAEGYVRKESNGAYKYVYQYKDYLGNTRLTYCDSDNNGVINDTQTFQDGFESQSGWSYQDEWGYASILTSYDSTRKRTGNYSGKIENNSTSEKFVHSNYWMPISNSVPTEYTYSGWVYSDGPSAEIFLFMKTDTETSYYTLVTSVSTTVIGNWKFITATYNVPANIRKLNLRIDNNGLGTVWFDDLQIKKSVTGDSEIIQEDNYYAFGLKHQGYNNVVTSTNSGQKYKYNGKELQDELGLNMYDYGARNYDPALGRWMNIDPLAEISRRWSPYNYAYDNPVFFIDPDGMEVIDINGGTKYTGIDAENMFSQLKQSMSASSQKDDDGIDPPKTKKEIENMTPEQKNEYWRQYNEKKLLPLSRNLIDFALLADGAAGLSEFFTANSFKLTSVTGFFENLLKKTTVAAKGGLQLQKSVTSVMGKGYEAVGEVIVPIKNTELLNTLNATSKGNWVKVYEAGIQNGSKIETHYFRNNVTRQVFDVKTKYNYWHQKAFKNLGQ